MNRVPRTVLLSTIAVVLCASGVHADWYAARREAMHMANQGQHEEARGAFQDLADAATNEHQRSDVLERAAMSTLRLEDHEEALSIAGRIPLAPVRAAVRMRLLAAQERWDDILEEFKDEDFSDWPRSAAGEAHYLRGKARVELGDREAALPDLMEAGRRTENARVFYDLAEVAAALNRDIVAMDAWRDTQRALRATGGWMFYSTVTKRADTLNRYGKHTHALAEVEKVDIERLSGYWLISMLQRRAAALAGLGRREEALADCRRALDTEGINRWQREAVERVMESLGAEMED